MPRLEKNEVQATDTTAPTDIIGAGIFDDLKTAMAAMPEKGSRRAFSHEEPRASIDDLRAAGKARRGEP